MPWVEELKNLIKGDIAIDEETLDKYSRDASIFEVRPRVVIFPKDSDDVKKIVKFVSEKKQETPELSLTARSGGTDMSGGSINESIIVEFDKYFNKIKEVHLDQYPDLIPSPPLPSKERGLAGYAVTEPGVYYRDFEKETLKQGLILPSYPASKSICAMGGIIANNSGGEKTLKYGKTNKYVKRLKVVLSDGNEYEFKKLNKIELQEKKAQSDFEGAIYRKLYVLLEDNFDIIQKAKPNVSKNSAGYYLWDVWDRENFDLTQIFTGSQGTLGIITEAELGLVRKKKYSYLTVVFLRDIKDISNFVRAVMPFTPESLETFDDNTLKLAMRFFPEIAKKAGSSLLSFLWQFRGEALMVLRGGIPKFVVLAEITGDEKEEVEERLGKFHAMLNEMGIENKVMKSASEGEKYWVIRRESFNLLRNKVKDKRATPFVDDFIVAPDKLSGFLPKLYAILLGHGIAPTLAGHAGDGNFHIIPLMDLAKEEERAKIPIVSEKVYDLVIEYGGSITAEHNDGLIRSPYLEKMYGKEIYGLFKKVKEIFDPQNIFNPGKKVGSDLEYAMKHIKTK